MRTERQLVVDDFMQRSGPGWGLVVSSVIAAAVAATCFAYLMWPPPDDRDNSELPSHPPQLLLHDKETVPAITPPKKDKEKSIEAFQQAVEAILKRAANTSASAPLTFQPIGKKVPLPRRRPVSSP